MSELRKKVLEAIRIIGNHSGCHQMPERSFFYKGKQFPVCARCTGVFFGQTAAVLLLLIKRRVPLKTAILFLIPMGADWSLQEAGILKSTNRRRLMTGLLGGFGVLSVYFCAFASAVRLLRKFPIGKD